MIKTTIDARARMEELNNEVGGLHIWLRTQANVAAQRPWHRETGLVVRQDEADGRVAAGRTKTLAHRWSWSDISPYLYRIGEIAREAEVKPVAFAERQQFLLTNPGLGGRLQVTSTIRCAISIYNPGDVARVHRHTPNASRTILSEEGGYTTIEGERCTARRGDLILTPNGTWHDHGNDASEPVVWVDILDYPLLEYLDCVWIDDEYDGPRAGDDPAQAPRHPAGYSKLLYGRGGIVPTFVTHGRGIGSAVSPLFYYRGADIRACLEGLRGETGDPYEGISIRFIDPVTGAPVFATLDYRAQLLRPGEETRFKRETSATFYQVLDGSGFTEVGGQRFTWETNDLFVVPNFAWRRHVNTGKRDAILYAISDAALMEKIGQYRAQGRTADGSVVTL